MKHKIMEALLSAENNLTTEEISWAIQNIPDQNNDHIITFDHKNQKVMEACGFEKELRNKLWQEYKEFRLRPEIKTQSELFEIIVKEGSKNLLMFLALIGLKYIEAEEDPVERLINLLKRNT